MDLSILVCAYDMARELPRTIFTLSRQYQRDIQDLTYEVIVVDNGSPVPVDEAALRTMLPDLRVVRPTVASRSPAAAINNAMLQARGQMLGLCIDGARMASPGLLARAREAYRSDPRKVIGSLAFHLGPDVQMRSVQAGYDQEVEDGLLAATPWRANGYALFDIAVLAGSSAQGWFGYIAESNGVFMNRAFWDRLGGLDERFQTAGGGFVNLDFWERAVALSDQRPWMILGEGTFHQVHGGAATSGRPQERAVMAAEYKQVRGRDYALPRYTPGFVGSLDEARFSRGMRHPHDAARRVQALHGRPFKIGLPSQALERIQAGTLRTRYKGLRLCKNPFDMALYLRLLQQLAPRTIIEVGSSEGGSAVWLRDQCRALGLSKVDLLSIDVRPPHSAQDDIGFFPGDSRDPEGSFPSGPIERAEHPWLVIEDSAHTYEAVSAVLRYFDRRLTPGDYIVVEDGVVADLPGELYRKFGDGPNRAVSDFLHQAPGRYRIDEGFCDFYGPNVTYCPNAWLQRI